MRTITTILFASINFSVQAQKLPAVQQVSLRAPANIKIDGRDNEWGESLQAYNKNVDVFYSIANDNNNLYLIIKATDKQTIYKIINGGISFGISTSGKEEINTKTFTYPKFDRRNFPSINLDNKPVAKKGIAPNSVQVDSFRNAISKNLNDRAKMVELSLGKTKTDTLISIYNDLGIKVAQQFDTTLSYVYEIAVPLAYLGSRTGSNISYNVKLNGMYAALPKGVVITAVAGADGVLNAMNPTDFSGEYTLTK